jgi:hypothetical protein
MRAKQQQQHHAQSQRGIGGSKHQAALGYTLLVPRTSRRRLQQQQQQAGSGGGSSGVGKLSVQGGGRGEGDGMEDALPGWGSEEHAAAVTRLAARAHSEMLCTGAWAAAMARLRGADGAAGRIGDDAWESGRGLSLTAGTAGVEGGDRSGASDRQQQQQQLQGSLQCATRLCWIWAHAHELQGQVRDATCASNIITGACGPGVKSCHTRSKPAGS